MANVTHQQTPRLTDGEKNLARRWHFEEGKTRTDIAGLLHRSLSAVSRLLAQKKAPAPTGRPRALTEANVDRAVAPVEKLVDGANGNREVTLAMIMRRCRLKVSSQTVSSALHRRSA